MAIRVFLLDDHGLVRAAFRAMLEREPDIEIVGEASTGAEGIALVRTLNPDVVLCDLQLPDISGLEVTRQIVAEPDAPKVVIVSMHTDGALPRRALSIAHGFVPKACSVEELLHAVREVARGRRYVTHLVAGETPFDTLGERQFEVAVALAQGREIDEIAQGLAVSASTIRTTKAQVLRKTGVRNVAELAALAAEYGVLDPGRTR